MLEERYYISKHRMMKVGGELIGSVETVQIVRSFSGYMGTTYSYLQLWDKNDTSFAR